MHWSVSTDVQAGLHLCWSQTRKTDFLPLRPKCIHVQLSSRVRRLILVWAYNYFVALYMPKLEALVNILLTFCIRETPTCVIWQTVKTQMKCSIITLLHSAILFKFSPALSDNWSWKPIFGLFESGCFTRFTIFIFYSRMATYVIPFSVRRLASNCRRFFSKNSLVISGSKSGSSPINCRKKVIAYLKS